MADFEMETRYDHEKENELYAAWEKSGYFNPDVCLKKKICSKRAKKFSIVLPPPNVTGILHMGHAAMLAIEDIMVRYARLNGRRTLWLPGTDHAAIATQSKVEKILYEEEGKSRHDLGRAEMLKRIEKFARESHDTIVGQIKKMGASVDWSREAYTLDKQRSLAVRTAFGKMYKDGLIYRGERIINWDPKLQTTVSDDEIEWLTEKAPFYYLKYGPFVIGTARPETKFGDKYVVMHPDDKRYAKYKVGEKIKLEWINGPVTATIVKDGAIDMSFGTGVMTITPWHDTTDFEIAERHKLDKEQIIDYQGRLLPIAGEFAGLSIFKARPLIVEKLKAKGLVEKIDEDYIHNVAISQRGGRIEPQIKKQWFVAVNKKFVSGKSKIKGIKTGQTTTLKELMRRTVKSGQINIIPQRFNKTYFQWIDNLRDWCISRQIWYGHRIPVWYCESPKKEKCREPIVSVSDVRKCPACGGRVIQDPDTLDTWFSSGLWTFSTLGWPKKTEDFAAFYPTDVLETGYDILFFWVARMILMSGYLLGDIPFKTVYLHGLVRDARGRKMSKSLGNTIDPLEMIKKYGADATRLALIIGTAPGNDLRLSEDRVRGYRNFSTKIWNASRFILMNYQPTSAKPALKSSDRKYLKEAEIVKKRVGRYIEDFDFNRAGETVYHYFWHTFADKIIEEMKSRLRSEDEADRSAAQETILALLETNLKILHPFMPFITEEIWSRLPGKRKMLMVERW